MNKTRGINTKIRILVLGMHGMLGHDIIRYFSLLGYSNIYATYHRSSKKLYPHTPKIKRMYSWDAEKPRTISTILNSCKPNVVINCIGDTKCNLENVERCFLLNSYLPLVVSDLCATKRIQFLHVSTDGVFDGARGSYTTMDSPSPKSIYALSKVLGENIKSGIVIRTSIIGESLQTSHGLIDWAKSSKEKSLSGYSRYIWNGVTTLTLAEIIRSLIHKYRAFKGTPRIIHVGGRPISKAELIKHINSVYSLGKNILVIPGPRCNRTLKASPGFYIRSSIYQQLIAYIRFSASTRY